MNMTHTTTPHRSTPPQPTKILFVCLGNICRSPAAHAVMQYMTEQTGLTDLIRIDSAGMGDWHVGQLPDHRMRRHGQLRGYAIDHRARQFCMADFDRFDRIVVMDDANYRAVAALAPSGEALSHVERMSAYLPEGCGYTSVPDPYYGGNADFELALDLIEQGCERLLHEIKKTL